MRRATLSAGLALLTAVSLIAAPSQRQLFFPIDDVRPGMVGIGRTVFAGETIDEFRANIVGVLRNVLGPRRDLILARLEGGPLATTGVIQGMSGSPVYIDGKLVGAVSYAIGSFPREPLAGITPIAEMTAAVDGSSVRTTSDLAMKWPAQPNEVFAQLGRLTERALAPLGPRLPGLRIDGPATLADLAPRLRPIGAAMVMSGFDIDFDNGNDFYAVNGIPFHYQNHPIQIRVNEKIRIYLVNILEFDLINSFHLHANFFQYYPTGTSLSPSEFTDTIIQGQAQRGILEFSYKYPGMYMFHAHVTEFAELGWNGMFEVLP